MEQYTIENKALQVAIMELLIDVLANQSAMANFLMKQAANGDTEQADYLLADLNQNIQYQWHHVFESISTRYAALPAEIWFELQKNQREREKE